MPTNLLVEVDGVWRSISLEERKFTVDDLTVWTFTDAAGHQWLTKVGESIDLYTVIEDLPSGLCLEFGVAKGVSITNLARHLPLSIMYGFDSWKGLPHDWNEGDLRGSFRCEKPKVPDNCELIEGLFSDTLEGFLEAHRDPVSFVHIDCDLYNSCVYVLHCLMARFVKGSVIAFDEIDGDFFVGELQAWDRYLRESRQQWNLLGKQHAWGRVYRYTGYDN